MAIYTFTYKKNGWVMNSIEIEKESELELKKFLLDYLDKNKCKSTDVVIYKTVPPKELHMKPRYSIVRLHDENLIKSMLREVNGKYNKVAKILEDIDVSLDDKDEKKFGKLIDKLKKINWCEYKEEEQ